MAKLTVLKPDGTKGSDVELPSLFATEPKKELLHQAIVAYLANTRLSTAHTKTRGEVRGGGRKPWRQKGTGRARAGSSRSPIWVGGGITFGPRSSANHSKCFPTKMRQLALAMALSSKLNNKEITVVEEINLPEPKTKFIQSFVGTITPKATSVLIVTAKNDSNLLRASRNLPGVEITDVQSLNTYDTLRFDHLLFTKEAISLLSQLRGGYHA